MVYEIIKRLSFRFGEADTGISYYHFYEIPAFAGMTKKYESNYKSQKKKNNGYHP
jgi:hypothetical protein